MAVYFDLLKMVIGAHRKVEYICKWYSTTRTHTHTHLFKDRNTSIIISFTSLFFKGVFVTYFDMAVHFDLLKMVIGT